jgi:hypothetical protein
MIKTLYFFCYYAYLQGDLDQALRYYTLLKEEFKDNGWQDALKPHQFKELSAIREAIKSGNIAKNRWLYEPIQQGPSPQPTAEMKQKDLVKKTHQSIDQLKEILQDDVYLYNLEHPCDPYGKVDMVYQGKNTIYPLEVKKDQGRHDLIGQISKYDLYHKLRLHYHHYEFVQGVTVCSSYDEFALRELKLLGIKTLIYTPDGDRINLKVL